MLIVERDFTGSITVIPRREVIILCSNKVLSQVKPICAESKEDCTRKWEKAIQYNALAWILSSFLVELILWRLDGLSIIIRSTCLFAYLGSFSGSQFLKSKLWLICLKEIGSLASNIALKTTSSLPFKKGGLVWLLFQSVKWAML